MVVMSDALKAGVLRVEVEPLPSFVLPLRVYYEDTDAAGIVYYANYLRFAERARTEMLRDLGFENSALMNGDGLAFAVRACGIEYLKPALLDDSLEVHTRALQIGGASLEMEQIVRRNGDAIAELNVKLVCMHVLGSSAGRPSRIPADIRVALENHSGLASEK
jgi:acyl-CoA thioester hydrolase